MHNYLNTYKGYFWHWDCDDEHDDESHYLATITDGQSITYYPKVIEILEDLQHQGLPPFGAILLVIIATNENIDEVTSNHLERLLLGIDGSKTTLNAIEVLDLIKSLPYRFKTGSNLTLLLQTLFKECHNRMGIPKSKEFLNNLQNDYYNYYINLEIPERSDQQKNAIFHKDIRAIALLIRRFKSVEDISNAMQNIPKNELAETLELEELVSKEDDLDKSFIEQLTENKNTYQIGSLIKRIWSGLNIPMHNNLPSSQPLGGVSDITNKGDFSRLLISEFAYDDDTFMSRITNNEALYIERETPPETNDKHRVFLIDASLKNWGIPKVLSFATTLAIAQHPKSNYTYSAFIIGQDYEEAPIDTLIDVIDSQQVLSGGLHPSKGLTTYFQDFEDDSNRELFFLTEAKNLEHPDLQNVLYQFHEQFNYIITTQTSGDIDFYKHQNRSRKHFQHILLPYEDIWESKRPKNTASKSITSSDLKIDHLLLEPIDITTVKIIPFEETYYLIQNSNVYTLTSAGFDKGVQLVLADIPYSKDYQYTVIRDTSKTLFLIVFYLAEKRLIRINLKTKGRTSKIIQNDNISRYQTVLFSEENNIVLSSSENSFWNVTEDSKLFKLTGHIAYSKSMNSYFDKIHMFKRKLRLHKVRYNTLKNIENIEIKESVYGNQYLIFNNFLLDNEYIKIINTNQNRSRKSKSVDIKNKQTLVLKRRGPTPLSVIKYLKEHFKLNLKEAKIIIETSPSVIANELSFVDAEHHKKQIENLGATCYLKTDYFESNDGSTIHIKNGQLIFNSSQKFIPTFYITSVLNQRIAMATQGEFTGNTYYLPVNHKLTAIETQEFYKKYINPFLTQILDNED